MISKTEEKRYPFSYCRKSQVSKISLLRVITWARKIIIFYLVSHVFVTTGTDTVDGGYGDEL